MNANQNVRSSRGNLMRWVCAAGAACLVAVLCVGGAAMAQQPPATAPASQSQPASAPPTDQPRLIRMTIKPAAQPDPALKYQLAVNPMDQQPGNAALLYYQAGIVLPAVNDNEKQRRDKINKWLEMPLKDLPAVEVRQTLDGYQQSLHLVELGSLRESCDWGLPYRIEGLSLVLPPLNNYRFMARLLCLRVRVQLLEHQYDEAVATLRTGYAFARHVNEQGPLISSLVSNAMTALMNERIGECIEAGGPNLYWALAGLDLPTITRALEYERDWLFADLPALKRAQKEILSRQEAAAMIRKIETYQSPGESPLTGVLAVTRAYPQAKKFLLTKGWTAEQVEAMPAPQAVLLYMYDEAKRWQDDVQKWFNLPYWRASEGMRKAEEAFVKSDASRTNLFAALIPSLGRAYLMQARLARQAAVLQCIEGIRMYAAANDGRLPQRLDELKDSPSPIDPFTGKPLPYKVSGDTFTIESVVPPGASPKDVEIYEVKLVK